MAFRPHYTGADIPYLSEYDPTLNTAGRTPMKQRCLPIDHGRLEADHEQNLPHYGRIHSTEGLRRTDDEVATRDRAIHAHSQHQYDSQGHQDSDRREHLYHLPPPYDPADEWYSGQRGYHLSRDPSKYETADAGANRTPPLHHTVDDDPFDSELHGHIDRHRFDTNRRPFHPHDLASSDFNEGSRPDMNLRSRTPLIRREHGKNHGVYPDYYDSLPQRVTTGAEPRLEHYDKGLDMALSSCRCDIGRAAVLEHIDPRYRKDFENHVYEAIPSREVYARWPVGSCPPGHRSGLDLRSFNDDIDPGTTAAAQFKYGQTPAQWRSELDTKDEHDAQLERQFTEVDPRITYLGHSPRASSRRRRHNLHQVSNPHNHHFPDPLSPSSEPNAATFHQPQSQPIPHPINNIRTHTSYNAPKPSSYREFLRQTAAPIATPTRTVRAQDTDWAFDAVDGIADTAPDTASGIRPGNGISTPDSTGEKKKSNEHLAISRATSALTTRAKSVRNGNGNGNEGSSSDGGCDTPSEEEEDEDDS